MKFRENYEKLYFCDNISSLSEGNGLSYDQISMPCECVGSSPVAGSRDYSTIL